MQLTRSLIVLLALACTTLPHTVTAAALPITKAKESVEASRHTVATSDYSVSYKYNTAGEFDNFIIETVPYGYESIPDQAFLNRYIHLIASRAVAIRNIRLTGNSKEDQKEIQWLMDVTFQSLVAFKKIPPFSDDSLTNIVYLDDIFEKCYAIRFVNKKKITITRSPGSAQDPIARFINTLTFLVNARLYSLPVTEKEERLNDLIGKKSENEPDPVQAFLKNNELREFWKKTVKEIISEEIHFLRNFSPISSTIPKKEAGETEASRT